MWVIFTLLRRLLFEPFQYMFSSLKSIFERPSIKTIVLLIQTNRELDRNI